MFTWAQVILAILRLVNWMIDEAEKNKWISEGQQREIDATLAKIKAKVEVRDAVAENVSKLDDPKLDDLLHSLEGSGGGKDDGQLLPSVHKDDPDKGGRSDTSIQGSEGKISDK